MIVLIQLLALPIVFSMAGEPDDDTDAPAEDPEPVPDIAPQKFSGDEPGRTDAFPIEGGLTVFEIERGGGGNFIVVLEDEDFQRVTGLVNTIGEFDGSTARHVEAGEYILAMNGRDWAVTVTQPRYTEGDTPPVSFSGENFAATEPFEIEPEKPTEPEGTPEAADDDGDGEGADDEGADDEGADDEGADDDEDVEADPDEPRRVRFAITHEGEGNVRIRLLDTDGQRVAGVLNDRGTVETVEQAELPAGLYLFDVQAEGEWTIDVDVE